MEDPEVIARTITEKLLVYGCGRPVTRADHASVDQVIATSRAKDFGLRSIIHAIVDTELFHRP